MLTMGTAPFAHPPGGALNFDIENVAPEHILYLELVPKRIRGVLGGETIVDTRRGTMLHETGEFIAWYLPFEDVRDGVVEPSERRLRDGYKGEATYYNLRVGERFEADAAWSYMRPPQGAPPLAGLVAFDFDRLDAWFEEEDEIFGHPRDPYHRFDCRRTAEHVEVRVGGETIAETHRAIKLFETSIPARYYIPPDDVKPGVLSPSEKRTYCPYKGAAAYFDVRGADTTVSAGAWKLDPPLGEAVTVTDYVSFWGNGTDVLADGRSTPT